MNRPSQASAPAPKRRRTLHRVSRRLPHLMIAGCCALTVAGLSGCVITDNANQLADLAESSVQDALNDAASAFNDVAGDIAGAFSGAQGDIAQAGSDVSDAFSDAGDTLSALSDIPALVDSVFNTEALGGKGEQLEIINAQTGNTVATYGNSDGLVDVLGGLDYPSWRVVSSTPDDAVPEYRMRITQLTTIKAGQTEEDRQRFEVATITTYQDSNVVEITFANPVVAVDLELPEADIAELRHLGSPTGQPLL